MKSATLDYIDKIIVNLENSHTHNLDTLKYLGEGILFLANLIKKEEEILKKGPYTKSTFFLGSSSNKFLPNVFNWFSISVTSYCRTVKFLDIMQKNNWTTKDVFRNKQKIKDGCEEYIKKVVPEIYTWRNKIAAHYAITDPKKEDNEATLEYSLLTPVTWLNNHYCVGALNLEKENEASSMPKWSIIETLEEKLIPRYWPIAR